MVDDGREKQSEKSSQHAYPAPKKISSPGRRAKAEAAKQRETVYSNLNVSMN